LRTKYHHPTIDVICRIFTELGDKYAVTILIAILVNTMNFHKTLILIMVSASNSAISNTLKSILREPRPFFVTDISPFLCTIEHGDPSGHSVNAAAIYATVITLLIREYRIGYWKRFFLRTL
jgi:hypothetical protein